MKKVLIIGRQGHGKTYVGKEIESFYNRVRGLHPTPAAKQVSTSSVIIDELARKIEVTPEKIQENKNFYRPALIELGNEMCDKDPACLAARLIEKHEDTGLPLLIVDGVRRKCEYEAVADLFDEIIYVYRDAPTYENDNFELNYLTSMVGMGGHDISFYNNHQKIGYQDIIDSANKSVKDYGVELGEAFVKFSDFMRLVLKCQPDFSGFYTDLGDQLSEVLRND